MEHLKPFTSSELSKILKKRPKETKFGQHVTLFPDFDNIYEQLLNMDVTYVLFGLKEDVGVFANYGNTGTSKAWDVAINALLNVQSSTLTHAKKVAVLGCLDFESFQNKLDKLNQDKKKDILKARKIVSKIDKNVSHLVSQIISAGKIPICVGGGHNNAYGNIKGASLAFKKSVNAINFDAHHDFRAEEGRHSGNGFSYAHSEGFLANYFIFGLHENYISENILKSFSKIKTLQYNTYEAIAVRKESKFKSEMKKALDHVSSTSFGLEIDCDAILNTSSSAMSPSGFSVQQARRFVHNFGAHKNVCYLHICEAAPTSENDTQVGKLISYLITDFVRSHESN